MKTLKKTALSCCVVAAAIAAPSTQAAEYPERPVRILVGYAPGGTPDIIARTVGEQLGKVLGQSFIVENRPGAGGTLATALVAKALPDGYTLLVADIGQLAIAPYLFNNLPYDPVADFAPVSLAAITPMFLVSSAKTTTIKTLQDLIDQAKEQPGRLNYGSSGVGSIHHISTEVFRARQGIDLTHVPYKGSGQSVPALLGGEVPVLMTALPTVWPHAQSGNVNLLATTSVERYPGTPDVPSLSEFIPGYDFPSEVGVLAPAGTPSEVLDKLAGAIAQALDTEDMRKRYEGLGSIPTWSTPAEYAENIRTNLAKYREAVQLSGAQAQ